MGTKVLDNGEMREELAWYVKKLKTHLKGSYCIKISDIDEDYLSMSDFVKIMNVLVREISSQYYEGETELVTTLQQQLNYVLHLSVQFNRQFGL